MNYFQNSSSNSVSVSWTAYGSWNTKRVELYKQMAFKKPLRKNLVILGVDRIEREVVWLVSEIDRYGFLVKCRDRSLRQMDGEPY